jgi:16S rRNA (cytosine967-C5)-methyltransferase
MVSARASALHALVALERGRADRLREALVGKGLDGRDQAFAFELAHGVLRRERLLVHVLTGLVHRGLPADVQLHVALLLGAYQLLFVPGMPAHAAVHETVELVRGNRGFANAVLRKLAGAIEPRAADPAAATTELPLGPERMLRLPAPLPADEVARLAIVHSLPDFLLQRWSGPFGVHGVRAIAAAASAVPDVFLRPCGGRSADTLRAELAALDVATEPTASPRLLRWSGGSSPFATAVFRQGGFVVQDPTALAAALAVPCGPGAAVVDLCAAPGTKTTLLAEAVRPGGRVYAYDPDARRRSRIVDNITRLRLQDAVVVVAEPAQLPIADAVLADVPCSNSGVLGRRVEVRRRLQPEVFAELASLQRRLLAQAIGLCRPGGAIVYSTCSIDAEENGAVVAAVLADAKTPRCTVERDCTTLPDAGNCDGGYFAVLRRAP